MTQPAGETQRYRLMQKLGEGTFGQVFEGLDEEQGVKVAVKRIRLGTDNEGVASTELREISILRVLHGHENIIKLLDVDIGASRMLLIFELCDKDLREMLTKAPIRGAQLKSMMYQLLRGVAHCHEHRIVHRDLKPQNILVQDDKTLKIADFGMARSFLLPLSAAPAYTHEVVTLWYRAPEILLGDSDARYGYEVDLWSCGAIMSEMAMGQPLFGGETACEFEILIKIFQLCGTPNAHSWPEVEDLPAYNPVFPKFHGKPFASVLPGGAAPEAVDLISELLICDPLERITAKEAIEHPHFADVQGVMGTAAHASAP